MQKRIKHLVWAGVVTVTIACNAGAQDLSRESHRREVERQVREQMGDRLSEDQIAKIVDEMVQSYEASRAKGEPPKQNGETSSQLPTKSVGKVAVRGKATRDRTKTYIDSDKLSNPLDQSVLDVLRRESGLIVVNGSVSIMGLPDSYTQLLVDGKKPPPTFSLRNLRPEEVEYIEIMFGAEADKATEGLAGSINIVLKRRILKRNPVVAVTVSGGTESGISLFGSMNAVGQGGNSFSANATLHRSWQNNESSMRSSAFTLSDGFEDIEDEQVTNVDMIQRNVWLRLNRVLPDSSILQLSLTGYDGRTNFINDYRYPLFRSRGLISDVQTSRSSSRSAAPAAKWSKSLNQNLDLELYVARLETDRTSDSVTSFMNTPSLSISRGSEAETKNSGDITLTYRVRKGTELSAGVSLEDTTWDSHSFVNGGSAEDPVEKGLSTVARRGDGAVFFKLVHSIGERLGLNTGLRYTNWDIEPAHIDGTGVVGGFKGHGLTPSLNIAYQSKEDGRFSLNFARIHSPPGFSQLGTSSLPGFLENNRPFTAWTIGNPDLKASVSDSAVLSWEKKLTARLDTTLRLSSKRIDDGIAQIIASQNGLWVSQAINLPAAKVLSMSGSIKYVLPLAGEGNALTLSHTMIRSKSHIDGIDSNLGIDGENPFFATVGAEVVFKEISGGLDLQFVKGSKSYGGPGIYKERGQSTNMSARISWLATPKLTVTGEIAGPVAGSMHGFRYFARNDEYTSIYDRTKLPMSLSLTMRYQY
ncbi:TonB-dependent receptor [Luteimonas sp. FXH3W]|uniref:TonB-dependent receptor n=1 Tax=Aquilutibacter rugosus TaxID=3115820 RepID=A0ABU7UX00_9GAMM